MMLCFNHLARTAFAALLVPAALLYPYRARAEAPVFEDNDFTFVDEDLSEACGFPVQVHLGGKFITTKGGAAVAMSGAAVTYTNLETGATVTNRFVGLQTQAVEREGSLVTTTFRTSGGSTWLAPGGKPVVAVGISTLAVVFDTATSQYVSFETSTRGRQDAYPSLEQLCAWLSE